MVAFTLHPASFTGFKHSHCSSIFAECLPTHALTHYTVEVSPTVSEDILNWRRSSILHPKKYIWEIRTTLKPISNAMSSFDRYTTDTRIRFQRRWGVPQVKRLVSQDFFRRNVLPLPLNASSRVFGDPHPWALLRRQQIPYRSKTCQENCHQTRVCSSKEDTEHFPYRRRLRGEPPAVRWGLLDGV